MFSFNFHTRCRVNDKVCSVILQRTYFANVASLTLVEKLNLPLIDHPKPYILPSLNKCDIEINKQVVVKFSIGRYKDEILCDVHPMEDCHLLLGRPWEIHRDVIFDGEKNCYSLKSEGRMYKILPLCDEEAYKDMLYLHKQQQKKANKEIPCNDDVECEVNKEVKIIDDHEGCDGDKTEAGVVGEAELVEYLIHKDTQPDREKIGANIMVKHGEHEDRHVGKLVNEVGDHYHLEKIDMISTNILDNCLSIVSFHDFQDIILPYDLNIQDSRTNLFEERENDVNRDSVIFGLTCLINLVDAKNNNILSNADLWRIRCKMKLNSLFVRNVQPH